MKILFLSTIGPYPYFTPEKPICTNDQVQMGISYISALLKQNGYETKLLILTEPMNKNIIDSYLKNYQPRIICFTATVREYNFILKIAEYVRSRYPNIFLFIGGVTCFIAPEESMLEVFDALCIGEGEYPTLELVQQLSQGLNPSGIANLWIKHNGKIEKNPNRPFFKNIDSLPFPDREMSLEWTDSTAKNTPHVILIGRGCPFMCTYCCNHKLRTSSEGIYVRRRSVENIISELEQIVLKFPEVRGVYLETETFGVNTDWSINLCSALKNFNERNKLTLFFGTNLRITPTNKYESLFKSMKNCGLRFVNIGLESGSEKLRWEILKRNYSNKDVINAVDIARKVGLRIGMYYMIGIPGETFDDFKETIRMHKICQTDWIPGCYFFPIPRH